MQREVMTMNVCVKDAKGTSQWQVPACPCKSWIEHWDYNSGVARPSICPVCKKQMTDTDVDGGHVKVTHYFNIKQRCWMQCNDEKYYITPICSSCNSRGGFTNIQVDSKYLVSAKKENCCRYRG